MRKSSATGLNARALRRLRLWVRAQGKCEKCETPVYLDAIPGTWTHGSVRGSEHHIIHKSNGGPEHNDNKLLLCFDCHYEIHKKKRGKPKKKKHKAISTPEKIAKKRAREKKVSLRVRHAGSQ